MKKIDVREPNLVGRLFKPANSQLGKLPAIILLSGSDGGIPGTNAIPELFIENLSQLGYIVLALAYFGVEGLPQHLENIELEYFPAAVKWLQAQAEVDATRISLIGNSRGGELALILGTLFPNEIHSIIAYVPSSVIGGGFPYPNRPAWVYHGEPMTPFLPGLANANLNLTERDDLEFVNRQQATPHDANNPYIVADLFRARNQAQADLSQLAIPVEKIQCPLLLLSGDMDAIWPSNLYCELVVKRLKQYQAPIKFKHINYLNAGHGILAAYDGPIYHPIGGFWCNLGGTPDGNKLANEESWKEVKSFLQTNL